MNGKSIEQAFRDKKERGWQKLYWFIDLHGTIIEGKYNKFNVGANFYPNATKVLANLSKRDDIVLVLWTSSHKESIDRLLPVFDFYGIKFKYINENPECENTELCDFSKKPYFNVVIDDKGFFNAKIGWLIIEQELRRIGEWKE